MIDSLTRPRFRPNLQPEVVTPDTVLLLSERSVLALRGRAYAELAPFLDGRHSLAEIVEQLAGRLSPLAICVALSRLEQRRLLVSGGEVASPRADAFWAEAAVECGTARERLRGSAVRLATVGDVDAHDLEAALAALGITVSRAVHESDSGSVPGNDSGRDRGSEIREDLQIVVTDDYLHPELSAINRQALESGRPWMLVRPVGTICWIGPLFVPRETGCWECLADRLRLHLVMQLESEDGSRRCIRLRPARAMLQATTMAAAGLAATEIARWLVARRRSLAVAADRDDAPGSEADFHGPVSGLLAFDLLDRKIQRHPLTRRPQCPACGSPAGFATPRRVELVSRLKHFTTDGGHRSLSPEVSLDQRRRLMSPLTGIVRDLLPVTVDDKEDMAPVYTIDFGPEVLRRHFGVRAAVGAHAAGKGKTAVQARASAVHEAIERHSALFAGDIEVCARRRMADLGEAAIPPAALMQFSERQYAHRREWNRLNPDAATWVPEPFDEGREIAWTPLWSLTHRTFKYVPTALCFFGYPAPLEELRFAVIDTNGLAAGNNLEEAILQGFMELVERDAVSIWWHNRLSRPGVDFASFDEPYLLRLPPFYRDRGRDLWALDVTGDLGIPVFVAVSPRLSGSPQAITFGCGAHFDPTIALLRAVTECNQMTWAKEADGTLDTSWFRTATVEEHAYVRPAPGLARRQPSDYPKQWSEDLRDDVGRCAAIAAAHGLEMLVLDQTRPDVGVPAVRVVVPGLRHYWPRLAPGRLYDVPVRLGWLPAPLDESQLNREILPG